MIQLFQQIWDKRGHRSEVSGTYLGDEPLTTFFHHIYPKSKYPELILEEDNIIMLTPTEHDKVEKDPFYYIAINLIREQLKVKYDL